MQTKQQSQYVYLDYAATAPLCEQAALAMQPYMLPGVAHIAMHANANSLHSPGRAAFSALEQARKDLACAVGAKRPDEIIFTSGATEADNLAIYGLARAQANKEKKRLCDGAPHVICSAIEHDAVLKPVHALKRLGFSVSVISPDQRGFITPQALLDALTPQTVLVSIQLANAEIGSIQDIAKLAEIAHQNQALFHTDATQGLGKTPLDVSRLRVDAASFASHKVYGPKGVGALYLKARTPFETYMLGGGQEFAKRSGTQNIAGIVGFAAAAAYATRNVAEESIRMANMRDRLYDKLAALDKVVPTIDISSCKDNYIPSLVHVLVRGFESETLILRLDARGFGVSGGSACASHSLDPSHVLTAIGIPHDLALGALRVTFGRYTKACELDAFVCALDECIHSSI